MVESSASQAILNAVKQSPLSGFELREFAMEQLNTLPTYDWSGIYRLNGEMLILDAYVGAHTDHTEIPVGRGVCGTAVAEDANQVVEDVRELSNYLSCSVNTRSEIVVLIRSQASGERTQEGGFRSAEQSSEDTPIPSLPPQLREGEGLLGSTLLQTENSQLSTILGQDELPTENSQLPTILGQIDIDGHQVGAFDATDEAFLTELGKLLAERWD